MTPTNADSRRWVWIDLDDTLVDFRANSNAALRRVYDEWHLDTYFNNVDAWLDSYHAVNAALWRLYDGGAITQAALRMERFRRPLAMAGADDADARRISTELDPAYLGYLADGREVIPGSRRLLADLRDRGYAIGILSNGFAGIQQRKLAAVGYDTMVDLVVLSDDIGVNKPGLPLYLHAMQRADEPRPERHLMLGDNPATDIAGALNAGWKAILFDRDASRADFEACPRVTALDDALPLVERAFKA